MKTVREGSAFYRFLKVMNWRIVFAEENRLQKLGGAGGYLKLLEIIDWEDFRPITVCTLI